MYVLETDTASENLYWGESYEIMKNVALYKLYEKLSHRQQFKIMRWKTESFIERKVNEAVPVQHTLDQGRQATPKGCCNSVPASTLMHLYYKNYQL